MNERFRMVSSIVFVFLIGVLSLLLIGCFSPQTQTGNQIHENPQQTQFVSLPVVRKGLPILSVPFRHVVIDEHGPRDPHIKAVGDVNGNGFVDLIVASSSGGPLVWYEYPNWEKHIIAPSGSWSTDAEAVDVDGDGYLDIIISEWSLNRIEWYENPGQEGDPANDPWTRHIIGSPRAHDIEVGDFDGDGDVDIVTRDQSYFGGNEGGKLVFWRQDTPTSWTRRIIDNIPSGEGLKVGDIDLDGRPNVIIPGRWFKLNGDIVLGAWEEHIVHQDQYSHGMVELGDINGNGRPDLIFTPAEGAGRLSWFEAPPDPRTDNWVEHIVDDPVEFTHSLGVADMNNDGSLDIVTAEMHQSDNRRVQVYLNEMGDGQSWTRQVIAKTGSHNAIVVDIGNDGDFDVFGANWGGDYQPIELWQNLSR